MCNIVDFYFILRLPTIDTVKDAITFSANNFGKAELKANLQLISQLMTTGNVDFNSKADKPKALRHLAMYVRRFEVKSRAKFKNTGQDGTYCARGDIRLRFSLEKASDGLREFLHDFEDKKTCRGKCRIDKVILTRFKNEIENYIKEANKLPKNNSTRGFRAISEELADILAKGADACSCDACAKVGDAIIALNAPRVMRLEHTDNSFDYLCHPIAQPHQKHPSEQQIIRGGGNP